MPMEVLENGNMSVFGMCLMGLLSSFSTRCVRGNNYEQIDDDNLIINSYF